jgi:hypothetical protein
MHVVNAALARDDDELLSQFNQGLVTRTTAHVAEEARLDGESLKNAVDRYEIDYAWHVLGSDRMQEEALAALEARLGRPVDEAQRAWVCTLLKAAAAAQPSDALMSFDNDVPEHLSGLLAGHAKMELSAQGCD